MGRAEGTLISAAIISTVGDKSSSINIASIYPELHVSATLFLLKVPMAPWRTLA